MTISIGNTILHFLVRERTAGTFWRARRARPTKFPEESSRRIEVSNV